MIRDLGGDFTGVVEKCELRFRIYWRLGYEPTGRLDDFCFDFIQSSITRDPHGCVLIESPAITTFEPRRNPRIKNSSCNRGMTVRTHPIYWRLTFHHENAFVLLRRVIAPVDREIRHWVWLWCCPVLWKSASSSEHEFGAF